MRYCDIVTVNVTHEVGGGGCIGCTKPPGLGGNDNGGITNPAPLLGKGGGNGGVINPVTLLGRRGGNGGIAYPVPAWPPRGPIADTGPLLTLAKSNVGTSVLDSTFPFPASTTTEWIWFPKSTTRTIYTKNPLSGWRIDEIAVEFLPTALKAAVVASFIPVFICDLNACIIVGNVGIEPVQFRSIIEVSSKEVALLRDWI